METRYLKKLEYDKIIDFLTDRADSLPGKAEAAKLLPMNDIDDITAKLKELESAIYFIKAIGKPNFEGLCDTESIIRRLSIGGVLNNRELLIVRDNSYLARKARELISHIEAKDFIDDKDDIKNCIYDLIPLYDIESEIRKCILSEDQIADDASAELQRIRRAITKTQESIKDKLMSYTKSEKYKKYLQDSIITMRQDKYVIPVKNEYKNEIKGIVHDTSQTGSTLFIEPIEIVVMNNKIRELMADEKKEIDKILLDLSNKVRIYMDELGSNFEKCLYLDIAFAKAALSISYDGQVPNVNNKGIIKLYQARHPLINRDVVVPIDFIIGNEYHILVITGPNTGGKTVTLKTVGLLTLMAQTGLAIPAKEGSDIAVFEEIFVDIGDEQSIEQNLSTFSSHMTNIIRILAGVNNRSMVLLDELGAGTDPVEGSALALAIIDKLKTEKITTVATTHYSELKSYASVTDDVENASCEFDVKTLKPTYRLLIGIPGKSNALYISRRLGLGEDIIKKANDSIDNKNSDYENIILSLEKSRQKMEKEREKTSEYKKEIENIKKELQKEKDNIDKEKALILEKAQREAKKLIDKALQKVDMLIDEIDNLKKTGVVINAKTEAEFRSAIRETREIFDIKPEKEEIVSEEHIDTYIKSGDTVILKSVNQKADVLTNPDKNGDITVQAGIIKMSVNVKDVRLLNEQKIINEKMRINATSKAGDAKLELDIRGMTVFEAEAKVEKFIEQGYLASFHELSIIHGKGTGALRKGVHDLLKANSLVESYRLGSYGEGEAGVTIVFLRSKK
jgi:DNA mismatch repair protein MutS2